MEQQEDAGGFYTAGRKFAEHIADSNDKEVSTATLQALIRDLLPQHEELQEALRSIVARPDFLKLVKLAGSGKGGAQKCALIESLRKIYSTGTIEAADNIVCGILYVEPSALLCIQKGAKSNDERLEDSDKNPSGVEEKKGQYKITEISVKEGDLIDDLPSSQTNQRTDHGKQKLSPVHPSHSLRNLSLILAAALTAGGIWSTMQNKEPQVVLLDPEIEILDNTNQETIDYGAIKRVPASRFNWDICRAAQDVRKPTSTPGEDTKQLSGDGFGRFAPVFNTKQDETWVKYSCSEIAGIYDW